MDTLPRDPSPAERPWPVGRLFRAALCFLAASPLVIGGWALVLPRAFYDDFPAAGRAWVSTLGPYDEHLVRDVGALYLALGVLLGMAAVRPEPGLVRAALGTWLVFAVPHFAFHLTHGEAFGPADNAAQLGLLGLVVLLPAALLALAGRASACRV